MRFLISALCMFISCNAFSSIPKKHFQLKPQLKQDFISLISKAKDFHKVIEEGGDKKSFEKESVETERMIKGLYTQVLSIPHLHQRLHSYKLLQAIEENLAVLKSQGVDNKRVIKKFFTSFFELTEVYNLKKDIDGKVFYCNRDKSTWFQSDNKPNNPISPTYKNCGQRL